MTLENFHLISCHWEGQGVGEDSPHSCTCKMKTTWKLHPLLYYSDYFYKLSLIHNICFPLIHSSLMPGISVDKNTELLIFKYEMNMCLPLCLHSSRPQGKSECEHWFKKKKKSIKEELISNIPYRGNLCSVSVWCLDRASVGLLSSFPSNYPSHLLASAMMLQGYKIWG